MSKKGLELVTTGQIGAIVVLAIVVILILFFYQNYVNLSTIVNEFAVERHAVTLANVILSYEKLAEIEGATLNRAVFDINKLDAIKSEEFQLGFPNSVAFVGVEDLDTGQKWLFNIQGPTNIPALTSFNDCFSKIKIDISIVFRLPPGNPWTWPDLVSCFVSKISRQGSSTVSYPIIIRDGESIHTGRLIVTLMEFGLT